MSIGNGFPFLAVGKKDIGNKIGDKGVSQGGCNRSLAEINLIDGDNVR